MLRIPSRFQRPQPRRGTSILELLVTGIAISAASVVAIAAISANFASQRTSDRLQYATQELANQMERVSALSWEALTPEALAEIKLDQTAQTRIPGARLSLTLQDVSEPQRSKKVTGEIVWAESDRGVRPPVKLVAWIFATKETP